MHLRTTFRTPKGINRKDFFEKALPVLEDRFLGKFLLFKDGDILV
jgi:hypothetical protein